MQVTREAMEKIEQALRDGTATEQGGPRLPFREYPVKTICGRPKKQKPLVQPSVRLVITVPCVVVNEMAKVSNESGWARRYKRFKVQRKAFEDVLAFSGFNVGRTRIELPKMTVTFTRIGGKKLDTGDNLNSCFKALKDAVAEWLGIDDGDERLTWQYAQEPGRLAGVRITVEPT